MKRSWEQTLLAFRALRNARKLILTIGDFSHVEELSLQVQNRVVRSNRIRLDAIYLNNGRIARHRHASSFRVCASSHATSQDVISPRVQFSTQLRNRQKASKECEDVP